MTITETLEVFKTTTSKESASVRLAIYPNLSEIFFLLDEETQAEIAKIVKLETEEHLQALDILFSTKVTEALYEKITNNLGKSKLETTLSSLESPLSKALLPLLIKNIEKYRYQIAVILTFSQTIDDEILDLLTIQKSAIPFEVSHEHQKWFLCTLSEKRLHIASKLTAVMLLNDHFLIKFNGMLTALCLQSFQAANGHVFLEGIWYSPSSQATRDEIRANFDVGVSRLTLDNSKWELLRAVDTDRKYFRKHPMTQSDFLAKQRKISAGYPPFFSNKITDEYGDTRARKHYREYFFEEDW